MSEQQPPKLTVVQGVEIGRGENKATIDPVKLYEMAKKQMSLQLMADYFECKPDTLKYNFEKLIRKGKAEGQEALLTAQWKCAIEDRNANMLQWLGKNYAGQSNEPQAAHEEPDGIEFKVEVVPAAHRPHYTDPKTGTAQ